MPILAAPQLALPDGAREDLAWQESLTSVDMPLGTAYIHTTPGNYFDILIGLSFKFVTDATATTRTVQLFFEDNNGAIVVSIPSPTGQGASSTVTYTAVQGVGAGYGSTAAAIVMQMPPILLLPGYSLSISAAGFTAGDRLRAVVPTFLHIPTGPRRPSPAPPLATPLLT